MPRLRPDGKGPLQLCICLEEPVRCLHGLLQLFCQDKELFSCDEELFDALPWPARRLEKPCRPICIWQESPGRPAKADTPRRGTAPLMTCQSARTAGQRDQSASAVGSHQGLLSRGSQLRRPLNRSGAEQLLIRQRVDGLGLAMTSYGSKPTTLARSRNSTRSKRRSPFSMFAIKGW